MKKITEQEMEVLQNKIWEEFLTNATPEEIHQSVITCNWDNNDFLLNWIKDNPEVDKATMLITYWMNAPRWMKQYTREQAKTEWFADDYEFMEEIEQKYMSGFWKNSNIEMDPACDQDGYDWTSDYMDKTTVIEIPAILFQKLEGKKLECSEDFDEGLPMSPIDYAQKVWDLYDEYEIV